jgi:hypothetical protein
VSVGVSALDRVLTLHGHYSKSEHRRELVESESDSFVVAARIPMSREGFEKWLSTPVEDLSKISNPEAMFDGWLWNGRRTATEWDSNDVGTTPGEYFAKRAEDSCRVNEECGVLLHRDGALEAYLLHFGYSERSVHTALLMFAAAGEFKSEHAEDTVLFWAETGANLWRPMRPVGWRCSPWARRGRGSSIRGT